MHAGLMGLAKVRTRPAYPSFSSCLLFSFVWCVFSTCALSQIRLAAISGSLTDPTGQAVPGGKVTIVNEGTGLDRVVITDIAGRYHLAGLPTGTYTARVEKQGFQTQVRESIALISGSELSLNFSLLLGELPQEVTVRASVANIDNTTSTEGGVLTDRNLTELPLNGRDLFSAAILEPGVARTASSAPSFLSSGKTGQASINGMRPSWTNLEIDGMDARDPVFGYAPGGASGVFLGLNEMTEVHILTGTFDVEYGGVGGGVIDAVTKSGSNRFHGTLLGIYRGASLDARNYFDPGSSPKPQLVRNQYGAGVGGPLSYNRTFFYANYEGFNEVQESTIIATVPNALAHRGLLPSANNPRACTNAAPNGCIAVPIDPRIQPFLSLFPASNGSDNGDGTADLVTTGKGHTGERHGMVRVDHNFSTAHSLFARYIIDDSNSLAPSFGTPPGAYVPGFPVAHRARNQYISVQDRTDFGHEAFNELRFGVNRTTGLTTPADTYPGISTSLLPGRPLGVVDIAGMSLLGNDALLPLGDFSTTYQVQDQFSRVIGRHTLKFGVDIQSLQSDGSLDALVNGLYTFDDLSPFGLQSQSNNPGLESFLQARPLSYAGTDPSNSDSHRSYRQGSASGFVQDFFRVSSTFSFNVGLRYDFYSNPTEAHGRLSAIRNLLTDSSPTVGRAFAGMPADLFSPQAGFAWNIFGNGKTMLRSGAGIFRDRLPVLLLSFDRFLPPFFGINSFVLPTFLNPQDDVLTEPLSILTTTYHPKLPYSIQYNLHVERELARGMTISAGYFGTRGNHLTREIEQNPFELALGARINPNLTSGVLAALTDAQSFYNSLQLSLSGQHIHGLSWQASYTFSHSIDDASAGFSVEEVNEPPMSQDPFDRKGSRGRSSFDIGHNFVANVIYELPFGRRTFLGGWQISGVTNIHSNLPYTPVLPFDNADLQSLLVGERPDLVGNPYTGACPNGSRVGTPSCWFNPSAFSLPPAGQFGNAGRNILRGPAFAQFDLALQKSFLLPESRKISLGVEAYNLLNHPNFGVPTNTQSPLSLGGNGEAVFKDAGGHFADNVGRILTTVGTGRQIQLTARFIF